MAEEETYNRPILRSPEVQSLVNKSPSWPLRWGTAVLLAILLMSFLLAGWIRYPEVIEGPLTLRLKEGPLEIVSQKVGILEKLMVKNGDTVSTNQLLAKLNEPLNYEQVDSLKAALRGLKAAINQNQSLDFFSEQFFAEGGSLQADFESVKQNFSLYLEFLNDSIRSKNLEFLETEIESQYQLLRILIKKRELAKVEYENAKEDFAGDQYLYEQEAIAKMQFYAERSIFIGKEQNLEDLKQLVLEKQIHIASLKKDYLLARQRDQQRNRELKDNLKSAIELLESNLQAWEQGNIFRAPFRGKVRFSQDLKEGQFLELGSSLMVIIPPGEEYLARVELKSNGQGKIELGQRVFVQLDNYPFREYGQLQGQVEEISELPIADNQKQEKLYSVMFKLNGPLITNYQKKLKPMAVMKGRARILTDDLSLLERILAPFRELFVKTV